MKKVHLYFLSHSIRMSGKNIVFNDKKVNKSNDEIMRITMTLDHYV